MLVLDTNVLVAAFYSRDGASHWLLEGAITGRFRAAVSVALALEYEAVLSRPDVMNRSGVDAAGVEVVLDAFFARALLVAPISYRQRPVLEDPADDMVLECAVEAGAKAIVTMNERDFAPATSFGINVLKPGAAVAEIRRRATS